jgi:hypothetical protein
LPWPSFLLGGRLQDLAEPAVVWRLCDGVFWQKSGSGILVTDGESIVRLDEPGAVAFINLLSDDTADMNRGSVDYVRDELRAVGFIEEADLWRDLSSHELAHLKAPS